MDVTLAVYQLNLFLGVASVDLTTTAVAMTNIVNQPVHNNKTTKLPVMVSSAQTVIPRQTLRVVDI